MPDRDRTREGGDQRGPSRGWLYIIVDRHLRVCYIGTTLSIIPRRLHDHIRCSRSAIGKNYGGVREVLREYEGFGPDKRHMALSLQIVAGEKRMAMAEGKIIAPGFFLMLAGRKYRSWENDASKGTAKRGLRSFKVVMRSVVCRDTIFKNQNIKVPGPVPKHLHRPRHYGFRDGGVCWMCGTTMVGGCNAPQGPKRDAHNGLLLQHRTCGWFLLSYVHLVHNVNTHLAHLPLRLPPPCPHILDAHVEGVKMLRFRPNLTSIAHLRPDKLLKERSSWRPCSTEGLKNYTAELKAIHLTPDPITIKVHFLWAWLGAHYQHLMLAEYSNGLSTEANVPPNAVLKNMQEAWRSAGY